jgi:hypothetical protein
MLVYVLFGWVCALGRDEVEQKQEHEKIMLSIYSMSAVHIWYMSIVYSIQISD